MTRLILIAIVFMLASGPVESKDAQGNYISLGYVPSCGKWTSVRPGNSVKKYQVENWVLGVLTGYNMYIRGRKNIASASGIEGILGWIDNYCRTNPLTDLSGAVEAIIKHLKRR